MERKADSLGKFFCLEEAAVFFLYDAFEHAFNAAQFEVAARIFAETIMSIEPEPDWRIPPLPSTFPEVLFADVQVISDHTASRLAEAWAEAQKTALSSGLKLLKTYVFQSIEVAAHIISLAACVESVINRHLFLLAESGKIEYPLYASLDKTEVIPKVLFAFKEQVVSKQLPISNIRHLFRLRNKAVHFKAATAQAVGPTVERLLCIWREVGQLFALVEGEPTEQQVDGLSGAIAQKWFE